MELADVGLIAWSFTGLEMARFGVPTVVAFDLHTPYPIGDVVLWKESREGYFECLDQALEAAPSLDQIRYAYRWSHLRFLGCAFDLGDVIPTSEFGTLPPYKTPDAGAEIESVLVGGRSALDINRDRLLSLQGPSAAADEHEALLRQLRRSIWYFCLGEQRADDYRLFYSSAGAPPVLDSYDAVLIYDGHTIEFRSGDRRVRRRSRLVQRLAALAAQNQSSGIQ